MLTPAGELHIDSKGSLIDFKSIDSDEEVIKILMTDYSVQTSEEGVLLFLSHQSALVEGTGLKWRDYSDMRRRVALGLCREYLAQAPKDDDLIIEAVATLRDLQKASNLLALRLAQNYTDSGVALAFESDEINPENVVQVSVSHASSVSEGLTGQINGLIEFRAGLENEIGVMMARTSPNVSGLVGPLLGAKLISIAKGSENLAKSPASKIQVLGAERAMFRHLKEHGDPPKHGIIFQHPTISKSPWWQRGKIARSLAAKIAIAARLDKYSDVDRSAELKADFMKRYEAVKKSHPIEPKKMRIIRAPKVKKKVKRRRR